MTAKINLVETIGNFIIKSLNELNR